MQKKLRSVREKSKKTRPLNGGCQHSLVLSAGVGMLRVNNFSFRGNKATE